MPLNYDALDDYVLQNILKPMRDQVASQSTLMKLLLNAGDITITNPKAPTLKDGFLVGGQYIEQTINTALITAAGTFRGYSKMKTTPNRTSDMYRQGWTQLYTFVSITHDEEAACEGLLEKTETLLKRKYNQAVVKMMEMIARYIHTYDAELVPGSDFELAYSGALGQLVGRYTGGVSYGGVDRLWHNIDSSVAGNEYWDANLDATAHTAESLVDPSSPSYIIKVMRDTYNLCIHGGQRPNLHVLPLAEWTILQDLATSRQTFNVPMATGLSPAQQANIGVTSLSLDGVPVIWDEYQPANTHYCLNMKVGDDGNQNIGIKGRKGYWFYQDEPWLYPTDQKVKSRKLCCDLAVICPQPSLQGGCTQLGV